ncbi:MAG: glycerophosphoryl diester phosphodiesterase [Corynebacterium sp.]|nr:glycerophosphoryl diester phosphodiesterase [Corynebacterium sp.]
MTYKGTKSAQIIAHRGANRIAPENTMAAFRAAHEHGCTWIETDVDVLGDGTPIIIHDTRLDRTTNAQGSYYDLAVSDLGSIDAGSWYGKEFAGEQIPTLHELIDFLNETGMNANIELKSNENGKEMSLQLVHNVAKELDRLKPGIKIIVSSFNHVLLYLFKQHAPQWPVGCLWETCALYDDWRSVLELVGADYIHPEDKGLSPARIAEFHAAGVGVNVWTVNDRARINELSNWGVDGIFTDIAHEYPQEA